MVKLNRTIDVANILSNKSSYPENITIKPDLSTKEREIDKLLMKKRWSLIQSGVNRKLIRIKKSSLYIQDTLYGRVENSSFHVVARGAPICKITDIPITDILAMKITDSDTDISIM